MQELHTPADTPRHTQRHNHTLTLTVQTTDTCSSCRRSYTHTPADTLTDTSRDTVTPADTLTIQTTGAGRSRSNKQTQIHTQAHLDTQSHPQTNSRNTKQNFWRQITAAGYLHAKWPSCCPTNSVKALK